MRRTGFCTSCGTMHTEGTVSSLRQTWRKKVVHCKRDKFDVYIGRPSKWGNPFPLRSEWDRVEVIKKYEEYIRNSSDLMAALPELKGKVLGCYCAPKACHGDVLIKLIEEMGDV